MASKAIFSEDDLSCPVCCDVYVEPVVLSCSHSMCKTCLLNFWTTRADDAFRECPVCRRRSSKSQPPCNLVLKNLCEVFLKNNSQKDSDKLEFCSLHNEKLKLFCLEDKQPVCLVCQTSKKHKNHDLCPIDEIVQDQRVELKHVLKLIQQKLKLFKAIQLNNDQTIEHIKFQTTHTERQIKMDFEKLHQFLHDEEAARLAALREEEEQKSHVMTERREKMKTELADLSDIITLIKEELKAEDISFLQNFNNTMERAQQASAPKHPEMISGSLMNVAQHLGNLKFRVWEKMQSIAQYSPLILDPNTASKYVVLSNDLTSMTYFVCTSAGLDIAEADNNEISENDEEKIAEVEDNDEDEEREIAYDVEDEEINADDDVMEVGDYVEEEITTYSYNDNDEDDGDNINYDDDGDYVNNDDDGDYVNNDDEDDDDDDDDEYDGDDVNNNDDDDDDDDEYDGDYINNDDDDDEYDGDDVNNTDDEENAVYELNTTPDDSTVQYNLDKKDEDEESGDNTMLLSKLPNNPERFCDRPFVQGFEGFNSGTHCWDTVVGESTDWTVGIMEKSVNENKKDIWKIAHVSDHYEIESPTQSLIILSVKDKLQILRVQLDWERGKLSFLDPSTNTCLHTFNNHFTHAVFPVFGNSSKEVPLRVLPLESSVTLLQPKMELCDIKVQA